MDGTKTIIDCALKVHTALGPGLLESTYQACLFHKLSQLGVLVEKEVEIPVIFEGIALDCGYRLDLLVERRIILEIKSVDSILPIHIAQLLTYLKLSNNRIGLLINFNEIHLKHGIKRIVNGY